LLYGQVFIIQLNMDDELIIEAGRGERQYWHDLWRYRELFVFLAWRDILVRYKQTVVGVAWGLIRPALAVFVLTMVGKVGKLSSGGVNHALFIASAMLPWQFFSTALSESGNSLVGNSNLISKVYFPRLIVPASSVITSFVDFLVHRKIGGHFVVEDTGGRQSSRAACLFSLRSGFRGWRGAEAEPLSQTKRPVFKVRSASAR